MNKLIQDAGYKQITAKNLATAIKKVFVFFNIKMDEDGLISLEKITPDQMEEYIKSVLESEKSENTKRTQIQRVYSFFKTLQNPNEDVLEKINKTKTELNDKYNQQMGTNVMTEKEKAKITKFSIGELQQAVKNMKKMDKTPELLQDIVILSLYVNRPPLRLDYANTIVVIKKPKLKQGDMNYLFVKKSKFKRKDGTIGQSPLRAKRSSSGERIRMYFYLNQDKVMDRPGFMPQIYEFLNPVKADILAWLNVNPNPKFLLVDKNNSPMSENLLGKQITKITKKYIGTELTNTDIRKIFINELHKTKMFQDMSEKEKEQYTKTNLRHSLSVERNVYLKKETQFSF